MRAHHRPLPWISAAVALIAALAVPAAAQDDDARTRARGMYEQAQRLWSGRPPLREQATALWERSYRTHAAWQTLARLAEAYRQMDRPAEALERLEQIVSAHGSELRRTDRRRVDGEIARLRRQIARLVVDVEPADATLRVGTRPLEAGAEVRLAAGEHVVVASREGYRQRAERVTLAGGEERRLRLELERDVEMATIDVRTTPQSAEIFVDGTRRGIAPLSIPLPVGGHRIRAEMPERDAVEREITLEPGDWETLEIDMAPTRELYEEWWLWTLVVIAVGTAVAVPVSLWATRQVAPAGTIGDVVWE